MANPQQRTPISAFRQVGPATGKRQYPITAQVNTLAPLMGAIAQVTAVQQTTVTVGVPALTAGATQYVTFSVQLAGLPAPLSVPVGCTAIIVPTVSFNTHAPPTAGIFGTPGIQFTNAGKAYAPTLVPGVYSSPALQITVPVYATATLAASKVAVNVYAILFVFPT
jgi:hypothetical protein